MSALARQNGWRGFEIGDRVKGGYLYRCDGMPTLQGCGGETVVTRRWSKVGLKSTGWYVCYGTDLPSGKGDDGKGNDLDVVLTFCPVCAPVVLAQEKASTTKEEP